MSKIRILLVDDHTIVLLGLMLARGGPYGAILGAPLLLATNFAQWAWTTMFLIYAALCAVGLWIAFRNVPETWQKPQQAPAALTPVIQRTKIQQFISAVPQQLFQDSPSGRPDGESRIQRPTPELPRGRSRWF